MLNNITWQGYWTTLAITSTIYYAAIYILYYRGNLKALIKNRLSPNQSASFSSINNSIDSGPMESIIFNDKEDSEANEFILNACMDEFKAYFEQAKKSKAVKEEIIYAVQRVLAKYPSLNNSQYKESITKVIISEAEHICSVHLNGDELVRVWSGG